MNQVDVIKQIYAAFGRGDVPAILERLTPDVEWEYDGSADGVPWLHPRRGREGAAEFFKSLSAITLTKFVPKVFLEAPRVVVVLIDIDATVNATGRSFSEEDEVHIWHLNDRGDVTRFRHRADTLRHFSAWRGTS